MSSVIVFTDTNLFFQCRPLHELPWRAAFGEVGEIWLLVSAPVQDEIDRLKNEGNTRRGRRARDANSLLRTVEQADPSPHEVLPQDPRVSIAFAPILSPSRAIPASLDIRRNDEALIAEALSFVPLPGEEVCVLTADGGMRRRARRHGLKVIDVPEEWKLPPEPTDTERRLRHLEAELEALKRSEPVLTVQTLDRKRAAVQTITGTIEWCRDLKKEELSAFETAWRKRCPRAELSPTDQALDASLMSAPANDQQGSIEDYEQAYETWIRDSCRCFESLPSKVNGLPQFISFYLSLDNTGVVPADDLLLEIQVLGGPCLSVAPDEAEPFWLRTFRDLPDVRWPPPPTIPDRRASHVDGDPCVPSAVDIEESSPDFDEDEVADMRLARPDLQAFYARENPEEFVEKCSFICSEFRHGIGPKVLQGCLIVPIGCRARSALLECRLSARNLRRPITHRFRVEITVVWRSLWDVMSESLNDGPQLK